MLEMRDIQIFLINFNFKVNFFLLLITHKNFLKRNGFYLLTFIVISLVQFDFVFELKSID